MIAKRPTIATNAATQAMYPSISMHTCWITVVRSRLLAGSAIIPPKQLVVSSYTCEHIPGKSISVAHNATNPVLKLVYSRDI